jgi:hypothetical protein
MPTPPETFRNAACFTALLGLLLYLRSWGHALKRQLALPKVHPPHSGICLLYLLYLLRLPAVLALLLLYLLRLVPVLLALLA